MDKSLTEKLLDYLYHPVPKGNTKKRTLTTEQKEESNTASGIAKRAPPAISVFLEHRPQVIADYRPPGFEGMTPFRQKAPGVGVPVAKVRAHSLRDHSELGQKIRHLDYLTKLRKGPEHDGRFNELSIV